MAPSSRHAEQVGGFERVDGRTLPKAHQWPPRRPAPTFVRATALTRRVDEQEEAKRRELERELLVQEDARTLDSLLGPPPVFEASQTVETSVFGQESATAGSSQSMASLYAQIAADAAVTTTQTETSGSKLGPSVSSVWGHHARKGTEIPSTSRCATDAWRQRKRAQPEGKSRRSDWFISRFTNASPPTKAQQIGADAEVVASWHCASCGVTLPSTSPSGIHAHLGSIAHQLSLSAEPAAPSIRGSAAALASWEKVSKEPWIQQDLNDGLELQRQNRGWSALERMGWRPGMGLGRKEWELVGAQQDQSDDVEASAPPESPSLAQSPVTAEPPTDAGNAVWRDWQDPPSPSRRGPDSPAAAQQGSSAHLVQSTPAAPSTPSDPAIEGRARRVPVIPIQRPDRRGIGKPLPLMKAAHRKSSNMTPLRHAELVRQGRRYDPPTRSDHGSFSQSQPSTSLTKKERAKRQQHDSDRLAAFRDALR
ncbi:G-patch domain [Ceraceosorus bombacis]|uniref:G-patch domain n=1 Tax=Ceraceosorus bombacis TaxID=401625 RepID=A0A0P1BE41_9BASI|nr:G-patch domain [Ceraceosorus bombacis]